MIDEELINRKYSLIKKDLKHVRKLKELSMQKFLRDESYELIAERVLERIIGRMIDVNNHIISALDEAPVTDYFSSFVRLGSLDVLAPDMAKELAQYAGLRNRLAHEYNNIDQGKVWERIQKIESDIQRFFVEVKKFVKKQSAIN